MAAPHETPCESLRAYYLAHSWIYDATRWSFLFGRGRLLREVGRRLSPARILEIGCGTGVNLHRLGRLFPRARLTGMDASAAMLGVARRRLRSFGDRVELKEGYYDSAGGLDAPPDLVCLSYCLSMMNPGVGDVIAAVSADLAPRGNIAVVDFLGSGHRWFRRWMAANHVRMEGHLPPLLEARFHGDWTEAGTAYGGLWRYFLFIGRLRTPGSPTLARPQTNPSSPPSATRTQQPSRRFGIGLRNVFQCPYRPLRGLR